MRGFEGEKHTSRPCGTKAGVQVQLPVAQVTAPSDSSLRVRYLRRTMSPDVTPQSPCYQDLRSARILTPTSPALSKEPHQARLGFHFLSPLWTQCSKHDTTQEESEDKVREWLKECQVPGEAVKRFLPGAAPRIPAGTWRSSRRRGTESPPCPTTGWPVQLLADLAPCCPPSVPGHLRRSQGTVSGTHTKSQTGREDNCYKGRLLKRA